MPEIADGNVTVKTVSAGEDGAELEVIVEHPGGDALHSVYKTRKRQQPMIEALQKR